MRSWRSALPAPTGIRVERTWTLAVRPAQAWRQTRRFGGARSPAAASRCPKDLICGSACRGRKGVRQLGGGALRSARAAGLSGSIPLWLHRADRQPRAALALRRGPEREHPGSPADGPDLRGIASGRRFGGCCHVSAPDGGFGLWSARDAADPWVSAFALDFLDRARGQGIEVDTGRCAGPASTSPTC